MGWEAGPNGELTWVPDSGGGAASEPYRESGVPGLTLNQGTGQWSYYGQPVTAAEAQAISDQYIAADRAQALAPRSSSSYNVSQSYQDPAALAQDQAQFDAAQAQAKEQWLGEQELRIKQLDMQQQQLAQQAMQANRDYAIAQRQQKFLEDKFAFESSQSIATAQRETQAQMFQQQAVVANMQLTMAQIEQQTKETNARLQQEVDLFNAGKAADVSMFNIDQQTKAAMFNAEGAFNAATFNEQHAFEVQKANAENERLRQQQLIDVAGKIADAAADPGDRGKLAAFIQALGGSGAGATDAALVGSDFRTPDSVTPLEAMLRQREDIQNSPVAPYKATPVSFTPVTAGQASFTPAQASQVSGPDFSKVAMPTPNTTPYDAAGAQAKANAAVAPGVGGGGGYEAYKAAFIAGTVPEAQRVNDSTGAPLTEAERAAMPDVAIRGLYDSSSFPKMAAGGFTRGAYIGDEKGPEMHIPTPGGGRMVVPNKQTEQMVGDMKPTIAPGSNILERGAVANMRAMPDRLGQMGQPGASDLRMQRFMALINALSTSRGAMPPQMGMPPSTPHTLPVMGDGGMMDEDGEVVQGPYIGSDEEKVHIPIPGTDMTILLPKPKAKGKTKGMPKRATGGLFNQNGQSIYEGLLNDTDRTRAENFLSEAGKRAAAQTGFDINRLPTPVGVSAPGTSPFLSELVASLNAIRRGIPQDYFLEQAQRLRPTAYSEGITGRTR